MTEVDEKKLRTRSNWLLAWAMVATWIAILGVGGYIEQLRQNNDLEGMVKRRDADLERMTQARAFWGAEYVKVSKEKEELRRGAQKTASGF